MGNYVEIGIELAKKVGPQSGLVIARLGARIPPYVTNSTSLQLPISFCSYIPLLFVCSLCYANLTSLGYTPGLKLHEVCL
ncbi:hypothetical protein ACN38_g6474 [Penicillium nordicum]|uniref:Uncharacterized protein n=1 Tax=Penicillium nordicum TaxID=229535 RepID=A0A0M8NZU5_9EURO|nr:hypothetical protein ACN38_g6474 [Penicillium nordicum]